MQIIHTAPALQHDELVDHTDLAEMSRSSSGGIDDLSDLWEIWQANVKRTGHQNRNKLRIRNKSANLTRVQERKYTARKKKSEDIFVAIMLRGADKHVRGKAKKEGLYCLRLDRSSSSSSSTRTPPDTDTDSGALALRASTTRENGLNTTGFFYWLIRLLTPRL